MNHPEFSSIPENRPCVVIFHINKLKVEPVAKENYGNFSSGDAYIIYAASPKRGSVNIYSDKTKSDYHGSLDRRIHMWLGKTCTLDESGTAAIKMVQLDDLFNGGPVQYRECEGSESKQFLSYFPDGVRYLDGGVESGFKKVDNTHKNTLFSIKGKRNPRVRQLHDITWSNLNEGDVFILDTEKTVFVWCGKDSNRMERIQGAKEATRMKRDKGSSGKVTILEDGEELNLSGEDRSAFDACLPLSERSVPPASEAEDDKAYERRSKTELSLHHCHEDESGKISIKEVKKGLLKQSDLLSADSYIIDQGEDGVYVWIGRGASKLERSEAMKMAEQFVRSKSYSKNTPVTRVNQGSESMVPAFTSLFVEWKNPQETVGQGAELVLNKIANLDMSKKFDVESLFNDPKIAAATRMVDDGSGMKQVFRIENLNLAVVDESEFGCFYSGDCYVIVYHILSNKGALIYFWLGSDSSQDEKTTAALKTVQLDDEMAGAATQVRVLQGKEPAHFHAMFGGSIIVLKGGKGSGFKNVSQEDRAFSSKKNHMIQVRSSGAFEHVSAIEVMFTAAALNSNDVFLITTESGENFIWNGKGSIGDEREAAKKIADRLSISNLTTVIEGSESDSFWQVLGGKEHYASEKRLAQQTNDRPARLFQCSNATGVFNVEEIVNFNQSDLIPEDVMLLDTFDAIWIWIGRESNSEEKRLADETALAYLKSDPSGGRSAGDTPIYRIKQDNELVSFRGYFGAWDFGMWSNASAKPWCWEDVRKSVENNDERLTPDSRNGSLASSFVPVGSVTSEKFLLEKLKNKKPDELPAGVDPKFKENFLTDDAFEKTFNMSREAFLKLPTWKRANEKKRVGLF